MTIKLLDSPHSLPSPHFPLVALQQDIAELTDISESRNSPIGIEDVQSRAQASLRACAYREVQRTTCAFNKGVLLLQGKVTSYYQKQMAQAILMHVPGIKRIVNKIQVGLPVK